MIHPENADEAVDRLLMLIGDLGVELADLASSAVAQDKAALIERFASLGQLGADAATLAEAGGPSSPTDLKKVRDATSDRWTSLATRA
jgi:hypothetical protein